MPDAVGNVEQGRHAVIHGPVQRHPDLVRSHGHQGKGDLSRFGNPSKCLGSPEISFRTGGFVLEVFDTGEQGLMRFSAEDLLAGMNEQQRSEKDIDLPLGRPSGLNVDGVVFPSGRDQLL